MGTYGRSVLVEANAGYDVTRTEAHVTALSDDTTKLIDIHRNGNYACFTPD